MPEPVLTRFAPSPTGYLHLGHAYAAQQAFAFGPCQLRIEDIDHTRCNTNYRNAIYDDLHWLGFNWPEPIRIQSQHRSDYQAVIDNLQDRGLIYRCFKSRKEQPKGLYHGQTDPHEDKRLAAGEAFAWRLSIKKAKAYLKTDHIDDSMVENNPPDAAPSFCLDHLSDVIVARKDIGTSYLIACTHDDHLQAISHVVRGIDLLPFTPYQVLLQKLMGWESPLYHHHGLLKNKDGQKLSKRNHDTTIQALRKQGFTAQQVLDMAQP